MTHIVAFNFFAVSISSTARNKQGIERGRFFKYVWHRECIYPRRFRVGVGHERHTLFRRARALVEVFARKEYRMDCDCSLDLAHSLLEVGMTPIRFHTVDEQRCQRTEPGDRQIAERRYDARRDREISSDNYRRPTWAMNIRSQEQPKRVK
jgi:hypothetical protein